MTLKTFSAPPTYVTVICGKFHLNPFTKWRDIASRGIGVRPNGQLPTTAGRPEVQPENTAISAYYCRHRHKNVSKLPVWWAITARDKFQLRILIISWKDEVRNEAVGERTALQKLELIIRERRQRWWFGRINDGGLLKQVVHWQANTTKPVCQYYCSRLPGNTRLVSIGKLKHHSLIHLQSKIQKIYTLATE